MKHENIFFIWAMICFVGVVIVKNYVDGVFLASALNKIFMLFVILSYISNLAPSLLLGKVLNSPQIMILAFSNQNFLQNMFFLRITIQREIWVISSSYNQFLLKKICIFTSIHFGKFLKKIQVMLNIKYCSTVHFRIQDFQVG